MTDKKEIQPKATVKVKLLYTCLNCEKPIPQEFELCSKKCLDKISDTAKKQGVKSRFRMGEVWRKEYE